MQQMRHFMHHNVFQALFRLFGVFSIEANRPSAVIATFPLGLHLLDVEPLRLSIRWSNLREPIHKTLYNACVLLRATSGNQSCLLTMLDYLI